MLLNNCIRFVAVAFRSEEEVFWRRGPSLTYNGPALDPPLGGFGLKVKTNVRGHEYFIPTKFGEYPSSDFVVKADYVYICMHCAPLPFFAFKILQVFQSLLMHSPTYKHGNYTNIMQIKLITTSNLYKLH